MLRIVAATLVVFDHSSLVLRGHEYVPLLWKDYGWAWGRVAVAIFFAISGFLVTTSWVGDPDLKRFAIRRVSRIWPALIVIVVFAALVLGPVVTELSVRRYFTEPQTWLYMVRGVLIVPVSQGLPGVFTTHLSSQVNGPLWTLGVEVAAYAVLAVVGISQLVRGRNWVVPALAVLFALSGWHEFDWIVLHNRIPASVVSRSQLIAIFMFASSVALYRDRVPLTWPLAAGAVVVLIVSKLGPFSVAATLTVPYLVVFVATRRLTRARHITRWGDPSYGMYVYGWPIQQLFVTIGILHGSPGLFFLASLVTCAMAGYASWHLFERRVLAWTKGRLHANQARRNRVLYGEERPVAAA